MCGILFSITPANEDHSVLEKDSDSLIGLIQHRGPDSLDTVSVSDNGCKLTFSASVLSLRGKQITPQPFVKRDENGFLEKVLCWNGEAWRLRGQEFGPDENDGEVIFEELVKNGSNVHEVTRTIEGPFSFIFYDRVTSRVWFGRDWLGRRSLLKRDMSPSNDAPKCLILASVSHGGNQGAWGEVEADGIYYLDLGATGNGSASSGSYELRHVPYLVDNEPVHPPVGLGMKYPLPPLNKSVSEPPQVLSPSSRSVRELHDLLQESLRLRVTGVPFRSVDDNTARVSERQDSCKIGILFSGGLDCTVLARVVHDILPKHEPVELLNVAFENKRVVAAANAQRSKTASRKHAPNCTSLGQQSMELAGANFEAKTPYEICPDRITGKSSFAELQRVCPERDWRFVEINVPYEEMLAHRDTVLSLIYPHDTEMDLSIGLAFYFAARPVPGALTWPRVLLSGLGADELFGGYSRHGNAFHHRGFVGLAEELEMDLKRLGKRNLGRDDRVIAHWGREARFPYLDERLLQEVVTWPADEKCGFTPADIERPKDQAWSNLDGEKLVLRLVAWSLGLTGAAAEKKRAIQFGSRTAKMELTSRGGRVKGTQKVRSFSAA